MSDDAALTEDSEQDLPAEGKMPPATLDFLVHTLFTQALMALGRIPNPITKQAITNIPTAKHFIDTLDMLEEKTRGNLGPDERKLLEEIQHQLRLLYLEERA